MFDLKHLNDLKPFIFVHIPRTAGTSILRTVGMYNRFANFIAKENALGHHPTALQIEDYVTEDIFRDAEKAAFIRNPWDRRLSEFCDRKRYTERHMGFDKEYLLADDFNGWIKYWYDRQYQKRGEYSTKTYPKSAWDFITNEDGNLIVNYVGYFERLEIDVVVMTRWIGLGYISLPDRIFNHSEDRYDEQDLLNYEYIRTFELTDKRPYQEFYEKDTAEMIAEMDSAEIDFFGYDFEGVVNEDANSVLAWAWRQCPTNASSKTVPSTNGGGDSTSASEETTSK